MPSSRSIYPKPTGPPSGASIRDAILSALDEAWAKAVARALSQRLYPVKMNYEIHGNTLPHLHMHLLPRQPDDAFVGRPIDLKEFHHRYTETDIELLKAVVRSAALAEA
jgi:diadenosine tetraphosphate (Ap4A) HIT family hydrolase